MVSNSTIMTTIVNNYLITLHRGKRVLEIGNDGNLKMVRSNGSKMELRIEKEEYDMRQSISLYYNGKIVCFTQPTNGDNVGINSDGIKPFIVEKEKFSQNIIALTNDRLGDLALDDYHGEMDEEGPIKWWNVWKDKETQQNMIKPNQWFNVKFH